MARLSQRRGQQVQCHCAKLIFTSLEPQLRLRLVTSLFDALKDDSPCALLIT